MKRERHALFFLANSRISDRALSSAARSPKLAANIRHRLTCQLRVPVTNTHTQRFISLAMLLLLFLLTHRPALGWPGGSGVCEITHDASQFGRMSFLPFAASTGAVAAIEAPSSSVAAGTRLSFAITSTGEIRGWLVQTSVGAFVWQDGVDWAPSSCYTDAMAATFSTHRNVGSSHNVTLLVDVPATAAGVLTLRAMLLVATAVAGPSDTPCCPPMVGGPVAATDTFAPPIPQQQQQQPPQPQQQQQQQPPTPSTHAKRGFISGDQTFYTVTRDVTITPGNAASTTPTTSSASTTGAATSASTTSTPMVTPTSTNASTRSSSSSSSSSSTLTHNNNAADRLALSSLVALLVASVAVADNFA